MVKPEKIQINLSRLACSTHQLTSRCLFIPAFKLSIQYVIWYMKRKQIRYLIFSYEDLYNYRGSTPMPHIIRESLLPFLISFWFYLYVYLLMNVVIFFESLLFFLENCYGVMRSNSSPRLSFPVLCVQLCSFLLDLQVLSCSFFTF